MSDSIYSPPTADLTLPEPEITDQPFYVLSLTKMAILFVVSLGMFQIVWSYKHWKHMRKMGEDVAPIFRTLFFGFTAHSLAIRINKQASLEEMGPNPLIQPLALVFALFGALGLVLGVLMHFIIILDIGYRYANVQTYIIPVMCFFFMWQCQKLANQISADPSGESNNQFGVRHAVFIIVTLLFSALGYKDQLKALLNLAMPT